MSDNSKDKSISVKMKENNAVIKEIFKLIVENKKWWLMPIFFVFIVISFFITIAGGSSVLPAIYALF